MFRSLNVHAHYADDFNSIIKLVFWRINGTQREVLRTDNFEAIEPSAYVVGPEYGVSIDKTVAQKLMDNLWDCGLRPTEGIGSAGSLAATQKHLSDLQKLLDRVLTLVEEEAKK